MWGKESSICILYIEPDVRGLENVNNGDLGEKITARNG